jgi:hypothetical protein
MNQSAFTAFLQQFETSRVLVQLRELNLADLIHNPWFLGAVGGLALLALFMKWRVLLATILSLTGFIGLISYTLQKETSLDGLSNDTLMVFVAGGTGIVFVTIYLLFIKNE